MRLISIKIQRSLLEYQTRRRFWFITYESKVINSFLNSFRSELEGRQGGRSDNEQEEMDRSICHLERQWMIWKDSKIQRICELKSDPVWMTMPVNLPPFDTRKFWLEKEHDRMISNFWMPNWWFVSDEHANFWTLKLIPECSTVESVPPSLCNALWGIPCGERTSCDWTSSCESK